MRLIRQINAVVFLLINLCSAIGILAAYLYAAYRIVTEHADYSSTLFPMPPVAIALLALVIVVWFAVGHMYLAIGKFLIYKGWLPEKLYWQ